MLGCGTDFYIPTGKSLTLPEYPGIQLSSHTVYPERASDPTGYGLGYSRLSPPAFQMLVPSLGCYLCFWPTCYRSEVPMTPSLGSNNLLQWLTELTETLYLLNYLFIINEYNWRSIRYWSDWCYGEKAWSFHTLWMYHSPQISTGSPTQEILQTILWVFVKALLHRHPY